MSNLPNELAPPKSAARPTLPAASSEQKRRSRRAVLIGLASVLVLGTASLWYYRSRMPQTAGLTRGRFRRGPYGAGVAMPVVVNKAVNSNINIILTGLGSVTPVETVTVTTQISGYLTQVNFTEGQLVNKGDVLAVIDPRPYQAALEQVQGQLQQAQAQYKEAQIDLDRYQKLVEQDSISKQQVDSQSALVQQYLGMVNQDQGAVDNAKLNLDYCHITAPFTGRVGLRLVDAGNYVTPNTATGLVLLTQVKPITVIFTLPEDNIPEVTKQLWAHAKIPVIAYNRDDTQRLAVGVLSTIDNTVDTSTGTFKLRATFTNEDETLFPNQFVNVSMHIDTDRDAIVIPTSAVERGQQGSFVYVVGTDNKVTATNVTLGPTEGERVAVTKGIAVGNLVVVDGADRLKDGMDVAPSLTEQPAGSGGGRHGGGQGGGQGHWNGGQGRSQQGGQGGQGHSNQGGGSRESKGGGSN